MAALDAQWKALVKQLNGLRDARNYVAHKAFALAFFSSVNENVDFQNGLFVDFSGIGHWRA